MPKQGQIHFWFQVMERTNPATGETVKAEPWRSFYGKNLTACADQMVEWCERRGGIAHSDIHVTYGGNSLRFDNLHAAIYGHYA